MSENIKQNNTLLESDYSTFNTEPPDWSKSDSAFALITLICSVIFASFTFFGDFALGFTLSYIILFALTLIYMARSEIFIRPFPVFCGVSSLLLSVVFTLYSDGLINFLLFMGIFILYAVFVSLSFIKKGNKGIFARLLDMFFILPLGKVTEPFRSYAKYSAEGEKKSSRLQIFLGLALSVPVLLVVIPLLISSDAAFEGLMSSLFSGFGILIREIILGAVISVFLFSLLFALKKGIATGNREASSAEFKHPLPSATANTLFIMVSAFYVIYLFSQLAYFFGAFSGILPTDYSLTAADYARRGFFELCAVCGINLTLIALVCGLCRRNEEGLIPISVKATATAICVFSVLFGAIALSKMILYIDLYGLTRLRLLTGIFILLLALSFIGVNIYLFKHKFPLAKYIIILFTASALIIGFSDVDKTIAHYNVERYKNGSLEEIDVKHLGTLSHSAVPYLTELLDNKDESIATAAANELFRDAYEFYEIEITNGHRIKYKAYERPDFRSYNMSKERSYRLIDENLKKIILKAEKPLQNAYTFYNGSDGYFF